jgi:hypothetical protein
VTPKMVERELKGTDSRSFHDVSKGHVAGLKVKATEWLSIPATSCGNLFRIIQSASAAAVGAGYDPAAYDRQMFYFPYNAGCGFGGAAIIGGGESFINGRENLENGTTVHELGHGFGIFHANSLTCRVDDLFVTLAGTGCWQTEYGDRHDVMGSSIPDGNRGHFGAYNLDRLGWLAGRVVDAAPAGGNFDITPIEQIRPGLQAVRLNDGQQTYWIFYRQPIGVDAFLAATPGATDGVTIQVAGEDPYGLGWRGSAVIDMTPDGDFSDVTLKRGVPWTTPNGAYRVQVTAAGDKSASIRIDSAGD